MQQPPSEPPVPEPVAIQLVAGIVITPTGEMQIHAAPGVNPYLLFLQVVAEYLASLAKPSQSKAQILRAGGPLPRMQ